MSEAGPILCSECGWTGDEDELKTVAGGYECPVCAKDIEFVD